MELKEFQKEALKALRAFLERARVEGPADAFSVLAPRQANAPHLLPKYEPLKGLMDVPYVCLRLPTGGGKTILAAHAVRAAAETFLHRDYPLTLWLVPSRTIKEQTLEALKRTGHPYRQALDDAFGGKVRVFDLADVKQLRPSDLEDRACVVLGTLQTGRVTKTEDRDIYAHDEDLEPHFRGALPAGHDFERIAEGPQAGQVKYSFANLLKLHRPLVITDEAHNADSPLTYEMYRRYNPACVIEFTATPDYAHSNVLYRVSAYELKREHLIKLPVLLTEHPRWEDAVQGALATRRQLAEAARGESELVRPIILFQAENKNLAVTVEVLKKHLIEQEQVPAERIAVVTGDQRELDAVNLFDPACPIECIITVQALKEGWDCSFAYVFCSVANIGSATAVEQLLGRVLRMPYAKRRQDERLNAAYAHVSSPVFAASAKALRDKMIANMGFEEEEADEILKRATARSDDKGWGDTPLFGPARMILRQRPDLVGYGTTDREAVTVTPTPEGTFEVAVVGAISDGCADALSAAAPAAQRQEFIAAVAPFRRSAGTTAVRKAIAVPRLCAWHQGELELVLPALFQEAGGWDLGACSPELPGFIYEEGSRSFTLDLEDRKIVLGSVAAATQAELAGTQAHFTEVEAVSFLDKKLARPDITQPVMRAYLRRVVEWLTREKGFSLALLDRAKFVLWRAVEAQINHLRRQAMAKGYQSLLFAPTARPVVSLERFFAFDPNPMTYPAPSYERGWTPGRHLYPHVAAMDSEEERLCAMQLDSLPQVDVWVRNLAGKPDYAFWLPTASDRFYPDFVARLTDGRVLVVEYKGRDRLTNDDTKEKDLVGKLWAKTGGDRYLFKVVTDRDADGRDVRGQLLAAMS